MSKKEDEFKIFGKYLILDHLVDGGMAKICRARFIGEQANKIVAIKMVQPQYSKDPSFVQMFEDELNVTFSLLHPNIAQIFDYGLVNNQLYYAMEYVHGANLKEFLDRLNEKNFVFPVEISAYIISQVSQALHYAHTFTDQLTGKPFNIIHRDISPHNIMLNYDGAIKVIDFGIAKADSNSEATQAGTIKGKLSYLAPEYLDGLDLDHRYDQFAVGITLWEMLCSRKLFTAKNDLAVLKQIQACKIPRPSSINPNVPKELDAIVLKALSKDRSKRYENMDKLNRALVKFLYSNYPDFNATDLGYFAKQLFTEEITADKKKFVEFGKVDIKPYLEEASKIDDPGSSRAAAGPVSDEDRRQRTSKIEIDFGNLAQVDDEAPALDLDINPSDKTRGTIKVKRSSSNSSDAVKAKKISCDDKTSRPKVQGRRPSSRTTATSGATRSTRVTSTKNRSSSKTTVKKVSRGKKTQPSQSSSGALKGVIAASILAAGYFNIDTLKGIVLGGDQAPKRSTAQSSGDTAEVISQRGSISFNNLDSKMEVYVNGSLFRLTGIEAKLPMGKKYRISVRKEGHESYTLEVPIHLTDDDPYKAVDIPDLKKLPVGYLSTTLNITPGSVISYNIDGVTIKKELPLQNVRIPAGGYDFIISNPVLGTEQKIYFEVKENKRNVMEKSDLK